MNNKPTPHEYRRSAVNFWIGMPALILIVAIIFLACSCASQKGCRATKGMSGYGWIKCKETGKVCILAPDGAIVYSYYAHK